MSSESRYRALKNRVNIIKYKGYDYRGRVLMRTTNPNLYKNDAFRGFAIYLERIINEWFLQAKRIKTFFNYIVPADSDDIN